MMNIILLFSVFLLNKQKAEEYVTCNRSDNGIFPVFIKISIFVRFYINFK